MNTIAHGNAAEAAVLHALTATGLHVLVPFGGGLSFDLVAVLGDGTFQRVQVKSGRIRGGCVEFNCTSTDHGRGPQHYRGRADVIAVHVASLGRTFMVPVDDCPASKGYLRIDAPRNNQRRGVRTADQYSFERWARARVRSAPCS